MKNTNRGFIFLMTLITTAVITLLVLTSMQHILLYHKAINNQEQLHQNFYQLEEQALQLARKGLASIDAACLLRKSSVNQSMEQLMHLRGCSLKKNHLDYRYLIEDLGEYPCLVVYKKGHKLATTHRRVSVMQLREGYPASFLQLRFISAASVINCLVKEHVVAEGVSSWRYLASVEG